MIPIHSWNQEGLPANRFRYRTNWRGKLILQIGTCIRLYISGYVAEYRYEWNWRDATTKDITNGDIV